MIQDILAFELTVIKTGAVWGINIFVWCVETK